MNDTKLKSHIMTDNSVNNGCQIDKDDNDNTSSSNSSVPINDSKYYLIDEKNSKTLIITSSLGFIGLNSIKNDEQLFSLTGIKLKIFNYLVKNLISTNDGNSNDLLITLIKLKTGMDNLAISLLFNTDILYIENCFIRVIKSLYILMKRFIYWQSKEQVQTNMPELIKNYYPNTRVIIDCIECKTEVPPSFDEQYLLYSSVKNCHTIKFLVALHPNGHISFVSQCFSGRSTEEFLAENSGFNDKLEYGDYVLVYKGFDTIFSESKEYNVIFIRPPFYHDKDMHDNNINSDDVNIRIYINKLFSKFNEFRILSNISFDLLAYADYFVFVISALINLQSIL